MSGNFTVRTDGNRSAISGELPFDVSDMVPVNKNESWVSIDKIMASENPIIPDSINWSAVTHNSWFICIRPDNGMNYSFPIMESENRDDNFSRPRAGIAHFYNLKYNIYSIGS